MLPPILQVDPKFTDLDAEFTGEADTEAGDRQTTLVVLSEDGQPQKYTGKEFTRVTAQTSAQIGHMKLSE